MSELEYLQEDKESPIWQRLPGEPEISWVGFRHYRDQDPPRKVSEAWDHWADLKGLKCEHATSSFRAAAKKWRWDDRVRAYQNYMDTQRQRKKLHAIRQAEMQLAENAGDLVDALIRVAIDGDIAEEPRSARSRVEAIMDALDRLGIQPPEDPDHLHLHRHEGEGEEDSEEDESSHVQAVVQYPGDQRRRDQIDEDEPDSDLIEAEIVEDEKDQEST